jgi:hypothetical protein
VITLDMTGQLLGCFGQIDRAMLDQFLSPFSVCDDTALDEKGVRRDAKSSSLSVGY